MNRTCETIVGLEIHVQLKTQSKLFCGCSTEFGSEPNTQTCAVCTGSPGALPVLNRTAIDLAIKTGLALNCVIATETKWDRKNYFYPDLPKGYQISQLERPICGPGHVDVFDSKNSEPFRVRIERAHLEEDAGKSLHDETHSGRPSRIDLNRTGTPLLEIVTQPDLRSGPQAKAFLSELKLILSYLDVSDCNMQQGSLRVDANVNVHIHQEDQVIATPIVEIKNLNSFRAVERAVDFEAERQVEQWKTDQLELGQRSKQTRGWNDDRGETVLQREKEEAADYRYFPDPDLVVIETTAEKINGLRQQLGELPMHLRTRLFDQFGLASYDADVIVNQGRLFVQFFEETAHSVGDPKLVSNWLQQEILRFLNENDLPFESLPITSERLSELLSIVARGRLDQSRAKDVLTEMLAHQVPVDQAMNSLGIQSVDADQVEAICRNIIEHNPKAVAEIQDGNSKAIGALIGQARSQNPNVNPRDVRECLLRLLG